jgi:hypothetical protein
MRQQWEGVGLPWMLVVLGACGNAAKPGADAVSNDPLASCEAFSARFAGCQAKLGAPAAVAAERTATTRETLRVQLDAAKTEVDRAALEAQCASGLKQLEAVCP